MLHGSQVSLTLFLTTEACRAPLECFVESYSLVLPQGCRFQLGGHTVPLKCFLILPPSSPHPLRVPFHIWRRVGLSLNVSPPFPYLADDGIVSTGGLHRGPSWCSATYPSPPFPLVSSVWALIRVKGEFRVFHFLKLHEDAL